jgi:deoxyribodipyrimidine photo-lyase
MTSILWLRRDLRRGDHPALVAAYDAAGAGGVLPVFVVDPTLLASAGPARLAALHEALSGARESFDDALVVRHGRPEEVLPALVREVRAASLHATAETTPYGRRRDERVRAALAPDVPLVMTGSPYAVTPGRIRTGGGTPYQVFTPYSRAWRDHGWRRPAAVPAGLRWHRGAASEPLPADVGGPATEASRVHERGALDRWHEFLADGLESYAVGRDRPDLAATSGMSVHLKFGTIHPRTMLGDLAAVTADRGPDVWTYVNELCWREFYADVLWHQPASAWTDLRPALRAMTYDDPATPAFAAWQAGRTGYPLVDAGMRQLLADGWMHNRVRMVTASFLVKDLHVWWPHGARHFLAHLHDGDIASNSHGWQWVAGTGTDAAPYFRVFNPVAQGERFDPHGDYVRRYVSELGNVAGRAVHRPWKVAGAYDDGYPAPIVDHVAERAEALRRYAAARS